MSPSPSHESVAPVDPAEEPDSAETPRPSAPSPAAVAARVHRPVKVPVPKGIDPDVLAAASAFGVVEGETVFVIDGDTRHEVGPARGSTPLVSYVKKYYVHLTALDRFKARLEAAAPTLRDIDASLAAANAVLSTPDCVGDLGEFRKRLDAVTETATAVREKLVREREEAKAAATAEREALVVRAEAIGAKDASAINWKSDAAELKTLLDAWKEAQQSAVHIGKDVERDLWHRFAHARSTFEKTRKRHFAELDRVNTVVAGRKEELVNRAEALATSTKWDDTTREFRDLMAQWKAAGRGRKAVDDALWARFQAAQDAFFTAKRAVLDAERSVEEANLETKEAILKEAEALLPIKDLSAAKVALHGIQDRFEAAGRVPKADVARLSKRLSAVEHAIREADAAAWTRHNPEVEARVSGAAQQLMSAIAELDEQIAAAKEAGEKKTVKELQESRDTRQAWLDQIQTSAS